MYPSPSTIRALIRNFPKLNTTLSFVILSHHRVELARE